MGLLLCCVAPMFVGVWVVRRHRLEGRRRREAPFRELRRRPAGEWGRLKVVELQDRLSDAVVWLAAIPFLVWGTLGWFRGAWWVAFAAGTVVCGFATWLLCKRALKVAGDRDNHQLGYDGERFVAEELSRLIANGFEVYHDVPFDRWNIDHVLVGPGGVFAVETKARRKPVNGDGSRDYVVGFDGEQLYWPWGNEASAVVQVTNNARTLSQWLSSAVGESVAVSPILALPGWMVEWGVPKPKVAVLNPKQIAKFCRGAEGRLNDNLIRRICHQLDQKCRLRVEDEVEEDQEAVVGRARHERFRPAGVGFGCTSLAKRVRVTTVEDLPGAA